MTKKTAPVKQSLKEKRHRLTVDLDPKLAYKFKMLCVKNHVTMNELIVRFIEQLTEKPKEE